MNPRLLARMLARLAALAGGYFWLSCPLCSEYFGGHEWRPIDGHDPSIPDPERGPGYGRGICPDCTAAGRGCAARARQTGVAWHECAPELEALGVAR